MRPDSIYVFEKCPAAHTRYKLIEHTGADVPNFPAVWLVNCKGGKKGERYVGYRNKVTQKIGGRHFDFALELDGGRIVTGLNFTPEFPGRSCGDFNGDGLLVEFSDSGNHLTVWFFEGMANQKQSLFQKWISGEILEVAAGDSLPLAGIKLAG